MDKKQILEVLGQACDLANQKGVFTLSQSGQILNALGALRDLAEKPE